MTVPLALTPPDHAPAATLEAARREIAAILRNWTTAVPEESVDRIVRLVQVHGVHDVTCAEVRAAAQAVHPDDVHSVIGAAWLRNRLAYQTPLSFDAFAAVDALLPLLDAGDASAITANVLEYLREAFEFTTGPAVLDRVDDEVTDLKSGLTERGRLAQEFSRVGEVVRHAQDLNNACPNVVGIPVMARRLVAPLSGHPHEIGFLILVQATELIFRTTAAAIVEARGRIAAADPAAAILPLDRAVLVSDLLGTVAPLYTRAMPSPRWVEIRGHIFEPSAVQGSGFPEMLAHLVELTGLLEHPRVPAERRHLEPVIAALVEQIRGNVHRWQRQHPGVVRRLNGALTDNPRVDPWLRRRADLTAPAAAPVGPAEARCPF